MNEQQADRPMESEIATLLAEANNRSRWYAAQLWQLPFAYLGMTTIALFQIPRNSNGEPAAYFRNAVAASAVFGVLVLLHEIAALRGHYRAVEGLRYFEQRACVPAEYRARHGWSAYPMVVTTALGVCIYVARWCKMAASPWQEVSAC